MALQSAFARRILYKSCNGKRFEKIELVRIGLRAPIVDMLYRKVWSRELIFAVSIPILTR